MHILIGFRGCDDELIQKIQTICPDATVVVARPGEDDFERAWPSCEVYFGAPPMDRADQAERLRWVQASWSGIATLGNAAPDHWIVTGGSGMFGLPIAEHVFAIMLHFRRHLGPIMAAQSKRQWGVGDHEFVELAGQTMLLLGLGDIGGQVAQRAKAFEMHVIAINRTGGPLPASVDRLASLGEMDRCLPLADVLVCALPGTKHTRGLLDARRLSLLRPNAGVINVGRGSLIDYDALADALEAGRLGWAGLDVFPKEPLPSDHKLWGLHNALISPHLSGRSTATRARRGDVFLKNLELYCDGRLDEMHNVFSRKWGY